MNNEIELRKNVYIYSSQTHKKCIGIISDIYPDDIETNKTATQYMHIRVNGKTVTLKKDYIEIKGVYD